MGGPRAVELNVLGDFQATVAGVPAPLPASKKTRALLGYLVLTGAPQLREHLCDLLWQGPDDPRGALRWSLTKLRGVLGPGCIEADRRSAAFVRDSARCDALLARAALARGPAAASTEVLRGIAASFRGELFEGLDLADHLRWHEWCAAQRESMRALRVSVLNALVERHADAPEEALAYARQRLAIDPLHESAHAAVVRILTALGRHGEASAQVDACGRLLAEELGTKPSPALLAARLRPDARAARGAAAAPRPAGTAAFTGRDRELHALGAEWRAARESGRPRAVLVSGEPGIGKTRLVEELAARFAAEGARVLRGRAFEAEMVRPYGPWIDAVRALPRAAGGTRGSVEELARVVPGGGEGTRALAAERSRLFEAMVEFLCDGAPAAGCVLVFDDLQWFDEASLALLHYVARAHAPSPILVACTARGAELADRPPLLRLVRAMKREERLCEMTLSPLDAQATSALARAIDPGADASRIAVESGGNPFFALELARAGGGATESLEALLEERLDGVHSPACDLLPWAAALGRAFRLEWLAKLSGLGDAEVLAAGEELERRSLLRADGAGAAGPDGYDFAHDLVRRAAYRRLSPPRRRYVHGRIARLFAGLASGDPSLHGDVAHHAALAGEHDLAAGACVSAAERCLRLFANDEAARLAETGLLHAGRLSGSARIAVRIALLQAKVLSGRWFRRAGELEAELSGAIAEARDAGMSAEASRGLHHLSIIQRDRGDLPGAHQTTLAAEEVSRDAGDEARARQLVHTARCLALLQRDMDRARDLVAEAATLLPRHTADFDWRCADAVVRVYLDAPDAGAALEQALALARRDQDRVGECECLIGLVQLALDHGQPARALAFCRELGPVAARMTDGEVAVAEALEALARAASAEAGADERLEDAISRLRDVDAKGMLAYTLSAAADLDGAAGRMAGAERRASEALAAAQAVQRRTLVASARASLAELALAHGDRPAAAAHLAAVTADLASPLGIGRRVRARLERIAEAVAR
ncbi:MAG: AAA family ATPase [Myxococcales bacterium]|nr:AAA family ATPase [Myxococcales bacterium]